MALIIKYPSEIKIGDVIRIQGKKCRVTNKLKLTRHSRENGYPYEFTGVSTSTQTTYKQIYYLNVPRFINNIDIHIS